MVHFSTHNTEKTEKQTGEAFIHPHSRPESQPRTSVCPLSLESEKQDFMYKQKMQRKPQRTIPTLSSM